MTQREKPAALFILIGRSPGIPWWWQHVDHESLGCRLECERIHLEGGRPRSPFNWAFVRMAFQVAFILLRARRRRVAYVFSFECDWLSFIIGAVQTLLMVRRPRHVILQFIMRERTGTLRSRLKYVFMKWCFRSVHMCICSSRPEAEYYARAFGWPPGKLGYVPFHTDPGFLERAQRPEEPFAISAGRTFRDYPTLLQAFAECRVPLTIVAGKTSLNGDSVPAHVTTAFDIPMPQLLDLIARSMIVVLPLQEREISVGQSVLLEAMAMGKPVVVSRVNGTVDYVEHMRTGLMVPPRDPAALREAVQLLAGDPDLRRRIGSAARRRVEQDHLPNHYAQGVARVLSQPR